MGKIIKNVILILLFFTLGVAAAVLAYSHFSASGDEDLSGEWTANLDMTEQAAVTALGWLQGIEAVSISLEDMESYMQDLTIQVNFVLEQTDDSGGTFHCKVLPESYEACKQKAYEAFAMAFQAIVTERLRMAGYTGGTDRESMEALIMEAFGMSTVSYLMFCGPALLPSLEELQAEYDGSGNYEATEGILTRQYEAGQSSATKTERYIRKDGTLILSEEMDSAAHGSFFGHYPMIYTLKQNQ